MNELQLTTGPFQATAIGLIIDRELELDESLDAIDAIGNFDNKTKQWWIGDILRITKNKYSDKVYKRASEKLDMDYNYLSRLKRISEIFENSIRILNLSFNHHFEVSSLKLIEEDKKGKLKLSDNPDKEKMQEFLNKAEKEKLSIRDLREQIKTYKRRQQEEIRLANEPQKYSIILADPAWEYDFSKSDSRQIDNQYLSTSLSDMKKLRPPAADNCVLFMWATNPKLKEALELISSWGFEYKTGAAWVKDKIGMGYYFRQKHELLLVAVKGTGLELPDDNKKPESVFFADRTEHSEKPEIAYKLIEQMYPEYNKLEMFSRKERDGWDSWGDEAS